MYNPIEITSNNYIINGHNCSLLFKVIYLRTINHSYWSSVRQLNAIVVIGDPKLPRTPIIVRMTSLVTPP